MNTEQRADMIKKTVIDQQTAIEILEYEISIEPMREMREQLLWELDILRKAA